MNHFAQNKPLTFFSGRTFDGVRWVLSFEGGPTALRPEARCLVTGRVGSLKVGLDVRAALELKSQLPGLLESEVLEVYRELCGTDRGRRP